ncbi:hypothetical protein B7P43_G03652 [Cryptotermes secundus]|uniref:Mos1 transposase HTH domain-containing protein n=1 Tax=Cryptotermes secundus TaxID=105785 RepID=A0A2J7Q3K5_9NEOP|nr:hypothetical protein B7P43_G03652 [Cryptotermes secundus]
MKHRCVIEFLTAEQIVPIHRHLLKVYGDNTVDVSTVRRWVVRFNSGESEVHDKPRPGRPCSAATPHNEQRLDQLIHTDQRITTRELHAWLNIGCNALETTFGKLDYRKVCSRPEKQTTFRLQHDNARPHTSLATTAHIARFGWTVLQHPPYSPGLAPSDFHLLGPMKDGLRGQHFPENDAVTAAVRKWLASSGADFYGRSIQALVNRWQKCITNGDDYVEK